MHFTYDEKIIADELMQGDVLRRTPAVEEVLRQVHPHFYNNDKNLFFLILTQSCDLVRRNGNLCKSPYISIAPVRSIDVIISKQLSALSNSAVRAELPVVPNKGKTKLHEFLTRLINNNEPGFFFLEGSGTLLGQDCVAFLNLSIALKSELHYDNCLEAKILQLDQTFQAKLGWLVGQLYSRVGTVDWNTSAASAKISSLLKEAAIWVEDGKVKALEEVYKTRSEANPSVELTSREIAATLRAVPDKKMLVLAQAERIIREMLGEERSSEATRLLSRLSSDAGLTTLLK